MFHAEVVLGSMNPLGTKATTVLATYPRFIHSEIMTHRDRARNARSSRAVPFTVMVNEVFEDPVMPIRWGAKASTMQTAGEIGDPAEANYVWLQARDAAAKYATQLYELGVHKSLCNRLLEPFSWMTVVMTATAWKNWFQLRLHKDAEIHFQYVCELIKKAMDSYEYTELHEGEWHLPFIDSRDREELGNLEQLKRISVARCANLSYHKGGPLVKRDYVKDFGLYENLLTGSGFGHWSPFEHQLMAASSNMRSGPIVGFVQYRKTFQNECAD